MESLPIIEKLLCSKCKHCRPKEETVFYELGHHTTVDYTKARCALTDFVTKSGKSGVECSNERMSSNPTRCGVDAKFYQEIPQSDIKMSVIVDSKPRRRWWSLK